jgi:hypothetical protein
MLPLRSITLNCCQGGLIVSYAPSLVCHENTSFEDISSIQVMWTDKRSHYVYRWVLIIDKENGGKNLLRRGKTPDYHDTILFFFNHYAVSKCFMKRLYVSSRQKYELAFPLLINTQNLPVISI